MKKTFSHFNLVLLVGIALFWGIPAHGAIGQWDFNSSNLVQSAGSTLGDLQFADGTGGATESETVFGSTAALGLPSINGTPAVVMGFGALTNGQGYFMPTFTSPNSGGSEVNDWTLIMDVLYPTGSDSKDRPIIDTDGALTSGGGLVAGPDFSVSASDGIGAPSGPYFGSVHPTTWYRLGMVATTNLVSFYLNGVRVGTITGTGVDGRFALSTTQPYLILSTILNDAASGYVNSIQIRDVALSPGQMSALGGPSAVGIPQTIPPVPAFIDSSTPSSGATGVGPLPSISAVLNQGDTTVDSSSIKLLFDGILFPASVVATPPTFQITASVTNILDPSSTHNLSLVWSDNVAGITTNTWSFTVIAFQNVTLPAPFYLETFDELSENPSGPTPLPTGWSVTNQTWPEDAGFSLDDLKSESYADWVLISNTREFSWETTFGEPHDRGDLPPIVLNGQLLTISNFISGNLMWGESDQRCGSCWGQYQEMYTADIDCTGRTNVYVAFNSFYEQNQDNMNLVEYSIDQGTNWLPVRYFFCTLGNGEQSDIYYTNDASGNPVIDIGKTFLTVDGSRGWAPWPSGCTDLTVCPATQGTNYGYFLKAPITTNLIPYIKGYTNDDTMSSKEIVVVRLAQADGRKTVRFRFLDDGTSSWFWGIDNLGLYEINTPVLITQPQSQTIDAGTAVTFSVTATSTKPLTYQWQFNGINIGGATNSSYTIQTVGPGNAGQFKVIVKNSDGATPSAPATLTVTTFPSIAKQPISQVTDPGDNVVLSVNYAGGRPIGSYWLFNGSSVANSLSATTTNELALNAATPSQSGAYQLIITNSYGAVTSAVAQVTVFSGSITNGLVVHLAFDGNLNDTSGRGNNATYAKNGANGDPSPTFIAGKIGQAFEFTTLADGSKFDYATLGYPADLQFGDTNALSISMWVNYTNQSDDLPFISNKDWNSSGNVGWGIFSQSGGDFRVNFSGPNGGSDKLDFHPTTVLRDGAWHNVVLSIARAPQSQAYAVYTYVDGARVTAPMMVTKGTIDTFGLPFSNEQASGGTALATGQSSWAVNIGQDGTGVYHDQGSAYNIAAHIDDVGIWRRALTTGEATAIFAAGQAGKDLSQAQVSSTPTRPTLTVTVSGTNLKLSWQGSTSGRLQTTATLSPANWTDVSGTTGSSSATVPINGASAFFRVAQ